MRPSAFTQRKRGKLEIADSSGPGLICPGTHPHKQDLNFLIKTSVQLYCWVCRFCTSCAFKTILYEFCLITDLKKKKKKVLIGFLPLFYRRRTGTLPSVVNFGKPISCARDLTFSSI